MDPVLTATEAEIAALAARGERNAEIAAALSVSAKTVEWHLSHVYRKLGVRSRTELAAHARTWQRPSTERGASTGRAGGPPFA